MYFLATHICTCTYCACASRFEPDSDNFPSGRNSLRKVDGPGGSGGSLSSIGASSSGDPDENQSSDPQVLNQQLRDMKEERDRLQKRYEQVGGVNLSHVTIT